MSEQLDKKSILEMSMGSILERVDYEMGKVIDNILDPNTKATGKRKITVSLELIPSADRKTIRDNGVSQEVEARQGVSLKSIVQVKPRVKLCPFRTFLEVQQPESEFILRLDEDGNVGLFEADGGMWRMTAKERICAFFEDKLAEEVSGGKVIVMM